MGKLEGKVALITGGTTGIGLTTAKRFASEGARVFVTGSNPRTLDAARRDLEGVAEVIASDAGDATAVERMVAEVASRAGRIDVLFLNAGIVRGGLLPQHSEADFDEVMRINVKGPWLAMKAAFPHLAPGGSVVLNGSISGHVGAAGSSAYAASKGAVRSMARVAATELATKGVRVNVLSPGPTDSGIIGKMMSPEATARKEEELAGEILMGRLGRTDEIASAALFLASDESSFMTGEEIVVDGGMTRV